MQRLRAHLLRDGYPRLQMLLLVTLTGGAGFLTSFSLRHLGWHGMGTRYGVAVVAAYGVFLLLLWLWMRTAADDWADGDALDAADLATDCLPDGGGSALDELPSLDGVGDADEFAIPLILLAALAALLLSSLWVVYSAPVLFAELLVDGALSATLYRRLRGVEQRYWLRTAINRTWWPFVLTAAIVGAAGWGLQQLVPEADSIGGVLHARAEARAAPQE